MDEILPNTIGLWALLFLCENDRIRIREFFACDWDIDRRFILREMHISVYHAQREMPGVASIVEPVRIILPAAETRFMTFAPGGFEPTPEIIPDEKKVGIRVHGKSAALPAILALRKRLLAHEAAEMLGERFPSTMQSVVSTQKWGSEKAALYRFCSSCCRYGQINKWILINENTSSHAE